jgi:hypothetical protein
MASFSSLIVPAIASGIATFSLSYIAHMVLKHHNTDDDKLEPQVEEEVLALLRKQSKTGTFMVPHHSNYKSMDECMAGMSKGVATIIFHRKYNFGQKLAMAFSVEVLTGLLMVWINATANVDSSNRFLFLALINLCVRWFGNVHGVIWKNESPTTFLKYMVDTVVYSAASSYLIINWGSFF